MSSFPQHHGEETSDPRGELRAYTHDDDTLSLLTRWPMPTPRSGLHQAVGQAALGRSNDRSVAHLFDINSSGAPTRVDTVLFGTSHDMHLTDDHIISANGEWGVQSIKR